MKMSFINFRTRRYLKRNKAVRATVSFRKAQEIGILFSVEDRQKHEAIKDFIKSLEHEGKHIKVIAYLPHKKENFEFLFNFFTEKDFSFWGNLTSHDALSFAEVPFDYLYCFDTVANPFILHLLARSKARCRIGSYWTNREHYFELMIQDPSGRTPALINEALKYTRELR